MQAPKCKQCGSVHWPRDGHKWKGEVSGLVSEEITASPVRRRMTDMEIVSALRAMLEASPPSRGRFDRVAYQKAYMREYMRKRRAAKPKK